MYNMKCKIYIIHYTNVYISHLREREGNFQNYSLMPFVHEVRNQDEDYLFSYSDKTPVK